MPEQIIALVEGGRFAVNGMSTLAKMAEGRGPHPRGRPLQPGQGR